MTHCYDNPVTRVVDDARVRVRVLTILLCATVAHAQPAADPPSPETPPAEPPTVVTTSPPSVPVTPERPPAPVAAVKPDIPPEDQWSIRPGGFLQPEFRMRQDAPGAPDDTDGFRLVRARLTATGVGKVGPLEVGAYFEMELQPAFSLYDAYVTVAHRLTADDLISLDAGQMRVPISRQQLLSDTRLSFVDKAQIGSIAPDRDLGARLTYARPHIRVMAGAFNGEGRDQGQNINESYLEAGRVEITPIGEQAPYAESAFAGTWLSIGASVGHDRLTPGSYTEKETFLGADLSGSWHGLSGTFEYLQVQHDFSQATGGVSLQPNYKANGFTAQVAYLLPLTIGALEIGARVEEIDRNDQTPIVSIGDPNQSERIYSGVISYYLKQHRAKLQLQYSHFDEIENKTATGQDATYDNDQLLLQLTYRVE